MKVEDHIVRDTNICILRNLISKSDSFHHNEARQLNILLSKLHPRDIPKDLYQELSEIIDMLFLTNNVFVQCKNRIDLHYREITSALN